MATQYERLREAVCDMMSIPDNLHSLRDMMRGLELTAKHGVLDDPEGYKATKNLVQLLIDTHPENQ